MVDYLEFKQIRRYGSTNQRKPKERKGRNTRNIVCLDNPEFFIAVYFSSRQGEGKHGEFVLFNYATYKGSLSSFIFCAILPLVKICRHAFFVLIIDVLHKLQSELDDAKKVGFENTNIFFAILAPQPLSSKRMETVSAFTGYSFSFSYCLLSYEQSYAW